MLDRPGTAIAQPASAPAIADEAELSPASALPRRPRQIPTWQAGLAFWLLYLAVFAAHKLHLGDVGQVSTFGIIMASIVIEAFPFILLGAVVAALIEVFVPDSVFSRLGRLPVGLRLLARPLPDSRSLSVSATRSRSAGG